MSEAVEGFQLPKFVPVFTSRCLQGGAAHTTELLMPHTATPVEQCRDRDSSKVWFCCWAEQKQPQEWALGRAGTETQGVLPSPAQPAVNIAAFPSAALEGMQVNWEQSWGPERGADGMGVAAGEGKGEPAKPQAPRNPWLDHFWPPRSPGPLNSHPWRAQAALELVTVTPPLAGRGGQDPLMSLCSPQPALGLCCRQQLSSASCISSTIAPPALHWQRHSCSKCPFPLHPLRPGGRK